MSRPPRRHNTQHSTVKVVTATVALAGAAYGVYKYLSQISSDAATRVFSNYDSNDTTAGTDSNPLRLKQPVDTSISLVISKTILERIEKYNQDNEDGIDLLWYLRSYPNLVVILYPGLVDKDLENYFELDDTLKSRVLKTGVEESVFHLLKQVGASVNLICFNDFTMTKEDMDKNFRLENVLKNVISLDNAQFTDFI